MSYELMDLTPSKFAKLARETIAQEMADYKVFCKREYGRKTYVRYGFIEITPIDKNGERVDIECEYFERLQELTGKSVERVAEYWKKMGAEYYAMSARADVYDSVYDMMNDQYGDNYSPGEWFGDFGYAKLP